MPPLSKAAAAASTTESTNPWIPVTWMPHTSVAQTCYVKLVVRAAFDHAATAGEWRVRATVHGMAGTPLGLPTETTAASRQALPAEPQLLVGGGCTHAYVWEETIRLPIRWRDLPRDSYLQLDILGPTDEMVCIVDCFSDKNVFRMAW